MNRLSRLAERGCCLIAVILLDGSAKMLRLADKLAVFRGAGQIGKEVLS